MMKRINLPIVSILILLLSLVLISCSSDSHDIEDENTAPAALVGKWMLSDVKPLDNIE